MIYQEPLREVQFTRLLSEGKSTFVAMKAERFLVRYLNFQKARRALDSILGPGKYMVQVGLGLGKHYLLLAY